MKGEDQAHCKGFRQGPDVEGGQAVPIKGHIVREKEMAEREAALEEEASR